MATIDDMLKIQDPGIFAPAAMPSVPAMPSTPSQGQASAQDTGEFWYDGKPYKSAEEAVLAASAETPVVSTTQDTPMPRPNAAGGLDPLVNRTTGTQPTAPGQQASTGSSDSAAVGQPAQEEPLVYNASGVPEPEQIPSGPIVTQKTMTGVVYDQADIKGIETATNELNKHLDNQKGIYEAIGKEQVPWYNKLVAARSSVENMLDGNSKEMKDFKRDVSLAKEKIDTASSDLIDFQKNVKVDPARYYKETPFLQHALNSVAMLLEGNTAAAMIRAGLPAPVGMVQARIDKAINDDIARQKDEIKSKEAGMSNNINRYRDNLKMLGDERAAEYKTRVEMMIMTQNSLNAVADKYKAQFDVSNIEGMKKQNLLNLEKAKAEMHKTQVQTVMETPKAMPKASELFVNVGGGEVKARTAEDAKAIKELAIPTIQGVKAVQRLRELSEKNNGVLDYAGWPKEDRAEAESQALIAKMLFKDLYKLGAWDAGGAAVLEEKVPKANTIGFILKKYDTLIDEMQTSYATTLNQRTVRNDFTSKDVGNAINADIVRLYGKQKK